MKAFFHQCLGMKQVPCRKDKRGSTFLDPQVVPMNWRTKSYLPWFYFLSFHLKMNYWNCWRECRLVQHFWWANQQSVPKDLERRIPCGLAIPEASFRIFPLGTCAQGYSFSEALFITNCRKLDTIKMCDNGAEFESVLGKTNNSWKEYETNAFEDNGRMFPIC